MFTAIQCVDNDADCSRRVISPRPTQSMLIRVINARQGSTMLNRLRRDPRKSKPMCIYRDALNQQVALQVSASCMLAAVVGAGSGCHSASSKAPPNAVHAEASGVSKPIVHKTKYWDGSVGFLHPDGSSTIAVSPVQLQGSAGNPPFPIHQRCAHIAQGAPYVSKRAHPGVDVPQFEGLKAVSRREFSRTEVERADPCAFEFGPEWRTPSRTEFDAYASQLAHAGSWFVRDASGTMSMVDYAPPIQLHIAEVAVIPARVRPALEGTAHVFCLRTFSVATEPPEPSHEEVERCVQQCYAPLHDGTSSVTLPDFGRAHLLAVRHACRDNAPDAEWLRILETTRLKVSELVEALVAPKALDVPLDLTTMDFFAALFRTMQLCIEQQLHPRAQSSPAILARLKELEILLRSPHERGQELRERQRVLETAAPPSMPLPEPLPQPRSKRCNCAESDLACNMRCAARH